MKPIIVKVDLIFIQPKILVFLCGHGLIIFVKGWLPGNYNGKISCHSTWSKDGSYTKAKALQAGRK